MEWLTELTTEVGFLKKEKNYQYSICFNIEFVDIKPSNRCSTIPILYKGDNCLQCCRKSCKFMFISISTGQLEVQKIYETLIECARLFSTSQKEITELMYQMTQTFTSKRDKPGIYRFSRMTQNKEVFLSLSPWYGSIVLHFIIYQKMR